MNKKIEELACLLIHKDGEYNPVLFYRTLSKLISNDLFGLMGNDYTIEKVEDEKPHLNSVLADMAFLLSCNKIKPVHVKSILKSAWETESNEWDTIRHIMTCGLFDDIDLTSIVNEVITEQEKAWGEYKDGKDKVIGRLVGQVMKKTDGKADPEEVIKLLKDMKDESF